MQASFWIGATGLNQHQKALDVVSNNVANVNTTAFKGSRIHFEDIFYQTMGLGGAPDEGLRSTNPIQKGYGVNTIAISKNFNQGTPELTGRELDLAILGPGFFVVRPPDAEEHEPYYTRDGHFLIDANGGITPSYPMDVDQFVPTGPINLVTPQGYVLQGVNASVDATTGQYVLPDDAALDDIVIDATGVLGPFATTQAQFGLNLDSRQPLAIDPSTFAMENQGVDRTVRLEFQRASLAQASGDAYYYFWAQNPAQNADGSYTTITDGRTGQLVSGVLRLSSDGVVTGVFENPDAGDQQTDAAAFRTGTGAILTDAELAGLAPWANVNGAGNPQFTVGTAPVLGVANEAATRPGGGAMVVTAATAFQVSRGNFDAGSLSVSMNGNTLVENVDYTAVPGTGTITPLTAWTAGTVVLNYTTAGGLTSVLNEQQAVSNANPVQTFAVANVPIQAGSLVVNGTRGGVALVEDTDYVVDYETGTITPATFWDPGAVSVNYDQADTRVDVQHNVLNQPIGFAATTVPGFAASFAPREENEIVAGTAMSAFDSLGNEHSLGFSFQRLSTNRWLWEARPTYRVENLPAAVIDDPAGGGTTADGMLVQPNTLIQNPDGTYKLKVVVDEGMGSTEWIQVPPGAAWPSTSAVAGYFQVTDATTGAVAFSRDINTTGPNFRLYTEYPGSAAVGNGIIAFDDLGNYDATESSVLSPLTFTPPGANAIAFTPDFTGIKGQRRQSDVTVVASDGFKAGTLRKWGFDTEGRIVADYTNGMQQYLARATLARFTNPEGMLSHGENMFQVSANSGARTLILGGTMQDVGVSFISGALESSNVDISEEFANMIVFQRAYQFNSRIVTTSDELTREAIQMKR